MKSLSEGVQLELVKSIKEVFESTLEVPFDTLETLSTGELVRGSQRWGFLQVATSHW